MHSVSAIIVINFAYVACYGWNTFMPKKEFNYNVRNGFPPVHYPNVTRHFLKQPLDHFDPNENRTFKVWYEQSLDLWKPNGPIYIWILQYTFSEESGAPEGFDINNYTLTYTLAQETNGAMFMTEKRYYGYSVPNIHKSDDNYLKYLNTSQQLADIAGLIKYLKSKPEFQSSKVVLLAWNLEGNLATWMRLVYPNLVDAAVAISAPVLAKKEVKEIYEYTAYLYDQYGYKGCVNNIKERFQWFRDVLNNDTELEFYKMKHSLCEDVKFKAIEDQQWHMMIEYQKYVEFTWGGYPTGIRLCERFRLDAIGLCFECSHDFIIKIGKKEKPEIMYQMCLEYGQYPTISAKKRPFDDFVTLDIHLKYCKEVFGIDEKRMDEGIAQTNLMYGGLTPNVTNVIFTQGEFNPYKFLGVQQNLSDSAPAFVLKNEGYSNINDIGYIRGADENRVEIINRVKTLIKKWIGL